MQKIHLIKEPSTDAKHLAFAYQTEAVNAVKDLEYAAIFHEQGLGKTKIAIDLMLYWLGKKTVDSILILTKKSLINNWKDELDQHTYLKPKVLTTDRSKNYYIFNGPSRVILCNFELIISEKERFELFQKTRSIAIIIDESAKIKNPTSTITKTLFELSTGFSKRIIMSGTPVANRPYDIWAQIYFLDHGISLGSNFNDFKRKTDLSNDLVNQEDKRRQFEDCIQSIYSKIEKFTVRETKNSGIITLPQKEYHNIITHWEQHQFDLYCQIRDELKAYVIKDGQAIIDESDELLKRLLRLVQVASNPILIDDAYDQEPGKAAVLKDLISSITSANEKAIVWTNFTKNADWLADQLSSYNAVRVHGKLGIEERNHSLNLFKNDAAIKILIATPAAAKEGLTLTIANHVIFYDRGFSLDDYLQAQDRIHRISQLKTCHIYNLIMESSIDEWVDVLLGSKNMAAQLTQGDIEYDAFEEKMDYSFGAIINALLFEDDFGGSNNG